MYANALSVAGTSHSLSHTWATNCSVLAKIMVSYGNKYPRHNARPHVVEQSGQCALALKVDFTWQVKGIRWYRLLLYYTSIVIAHRAARSYHSYQPHAFVYPHRTASFHPHLAITCSERNQIYVELMVSLFPCNKLGFHITPSRSEQKAFNYSLSGIELIGCILRYSFISM